MRVTSLFLVLVLAGCPRPLPNPGTVVLSCTMDAVKDPKVIKAVMDALAQDNFMSALASLVSPALNITAEVVTCILNSYMAKPAADRGSPELYGRARSYLKQHGYEVP